MTAGKKLLVFIVTQTDSALTFQLKRCSCKKPSDITRSTVKHRPGQTLKHPSEHKRVVLSFTLVGPTPMLQCIEGLMIN